MRARSAAGIVLGDGHARPPRARAVAATPARTAPARRTAAVVHRPRRSSASPTAPASTPTRAAPASRPSSRTPPTSERMTLIAGSAPDALRAGRRARIARPMTARCRPAARRGRRAAARPDPRRHVEPAGQRDGGRRAAARLPRPPRHRVRAGRARARPREPRRADPRQRRRPVARADRPHRRRARRRARLAAAAVRGRDRRRRLRVGPRRGRHEEPHRDERGRAGDAGARGLPPARRPRADRPGRRGGRQRGGRDAVARRGAARPARRLRRRRGRRASASRSPTAASSSRSASAEKACLPVLVTALGEAGHASTPHLGRQRRAAAGDADRPDRRATGPPRRVLPVVRRDARAARRRPDGDLDAAIAHVAARTPRARRRPAEPARR